MSDSVQMPALGESVTEGTVTRWLKKVGERIEVDEPLLEVSTDKVDTEIPSPTAGVLESILVGEDETVAVGTLLAVISSGAGSSSRAGNSSGAGTSGGAQATAPAPAPTTTAAAVPVAVAAAVPAAAAVPPAPVASSAGNAITMPALGESVTEGTVTRWLKAEGDTVDVDEPLLEVSTDKVDTEIPSPYAGVVTRIIVGEDETVPVGTTLAIVSAVAATPVTGAPAAPAPAAPTPTFFAPAPAPAAPLPPTPAPVASAPAVPAPANLVPRPSAPLQNGPGSPVPPRGGVVATGDVSVYVTPLVRRMALENGIDLTTIQGTGVGGRIRKHDVLDASARAKAAVANSAARAAAPSALRGTTEKMSRLRKVIAQRMVESLHVSAQLTTVVEIDVTKVARLRARAKDEFEAREGVKLSFLPFFALAAVDALKQHPVINASVEDDSIVYHAEENLGVAVDTDRGLLVPVIRSAGDLNIAGIAGKIADLADRTRRNRIMPDDLAGGTFTLTNTGSRGALFDTPIINQPQVAILGTGAVVKRPVVVSDLDGGETIAIRSMVYFALSYDHRIVDGAAAANFLVAIKHRLEEGAFDADLGL